MWKSRLLSLFLSATVLLQPGTSGALTCGGLLSAISLGAQSQTAPFDLQAFDAEKTRLQNKISRSEKIESADLAGDMAKMALFEVVAQESGWDLLNLSKIAGDGTESAQRKVQRIFSGLSLDDGISVRKLEKLLTKLYVLSNSSARQWSVSVSAARERLIKKRIETAFLTQSFTDALRSLGLVRDPTLLDKVGEFRSRYSNQENLLITSAINVFSVTHIGLPIHVPLLSFGERRPIPQAIIQKIKMYGIESARDDLERIYSGHSNFQLAWNTVRKTYTTAMMGFAIFMSVQMFPMLEYSVASLLTTNERLEQVQEATFNPQAIRDQQFNSWKQAFYELEGRYPDPAHYPQDAAEWNRVKGTLAAIPDEQLKVQFNILTVSPRL